MKNQHTIPKRKDLQTEVVEEVEVVTEEVVVTKGVVLVEKEEAEAGKVEGIGKGNRYSVGSIQ